MGCKKLEDTVDIFKSPRVGIGSLISGVYGCIMTRTYVREWVDWTVIISRARPDIYK